MNNPATGAMPDSLGDSLGDSLLSHQAFIRRIAHALSRDSHEADDLVQDTWVRALTSRPLTDRGLGPWLAASARGLARNGRRSAQRRRLHESISMDAGAAETTTEAVEQLAVRQEVVAAVLALEEPFRSTVVMVYERGLTPSEIANSEGVAASTVRTRLFRAHDKLRERLADSDVDPKRLAGLAALPAWGRRKASAAVPAKAWLACAGALLLVTAAVNSSMGERDGAEPTATRQAGSSAALAMTEVPLAVPKVNTSRAEVPEQEAVSEVPIDHPYWVAVRAARSGLQSYGPKTEQEATLWKSLAASRGEPAKLPAEVGLRASLASFEEALGLPVRVSEEALDDSDPDDIGLEWIAPCAELPMETWLSLIIACSGYGDVSWDVSDGAILVDTAEGLKSCVEAFKFGLDDLLLQPKEFFADGDVPHSIYAEMERPDYITLCTSRSANPSRVNLLDEEGAAPGVPMTSMTLSDTARGHRSTQGYLDAVRRFRQPLPEEGISGETLRFPAIARSDQRVIDELRRNGGWKALQPQENKTLESQLRTFAATAKVGVLWTSAARAPGVKFSDLGFEIAFGSLLVRASFERFGFDQAEMWFDLRTFMTGAEVTGAAAARHDILRALDARGEPLKLTASGLNNFIYQQVDPESWDNDPRLSIRVTSDDCLAVQQNLAALDEISALVDALRASN